jgi:aromatic-L-amino-acid decarboxylase
MVAGIGERTVRIPTHGSSRAMDVEAEARILADRGRTAPGGRDPVCGWHQKGATDDVAAVAIAARHGLYTHVDAAWAGSAMICPEFRDLWRGVELADSVVLNPHKWLGAQFDCSTHFVRDPASLVRTLAIQPEYLRTHGKRDFINYSEWHVPLGRRFRALKLWFLLRARPAGPRR